MPYFKCTSEVLGFLLTSEFGFGTIHVNGRFRSLSKHGYIYFWRFFALQRLYKDGLVLSRPLAMGRYVLAWLTRNVQQSSRDGWLIGRELLRKSM
jgi:hypothetical protein